MHDEGGRNSKLHDRYVTKDVTGEGLGVGLRFGDVKVYKHPHLQMLIMQTNVK